MPNAAQLNDAQWRCRSAITGGQRSQVPNLRHRVGKWKPLTFPLCADSLGRPGLAAGQKNQCWAAWKTAQTAIHPRMEPYLTSSSSWPTQRTHAMLRSHPGNRLALDERLQLEAADLAAVTLYYIRTSNGPMSVLSGALSARPKLSVHAGGHCSPRAHNSGTAVSKQDRPSLVRCMEFCFGFGRWRSFASTRGSHRSIGSIRRQSPLT